MIRDFSRGNQDSLEREALAFLHFEELEGDLSHLPAPGQTVGDFLLETEIGRGGSGIVFRARQQQLDRIVALKLIPLGTVPLQKHALMRIEREGRILAQLRHESIIRVYDAGVQPGFFWVAMDWIAGHTLRDLIHDRVPGFAHPGQPEWIPFVLRILSKVADALAAAHRLGLIHRDVKPENILIDADGNPYLADFGLARPIAGSEITMTRGFVGTPRYASPEQVSGSSLSLASDVFSFGAVAFEGISGKIAFEARSFQEFSQRIQYVEPSWPDSLSIPRDLKAVIEKCLEKKPQDRYQDAQQVRDEFHRLIHFEPVRAVPRKWWSRAWRRWTRRPGGKALLTGVALVLFIAIVAGIGLWLQYRTMTRVEALGRLQAAEDHYQKGETKEWFHELHLLHKEFPQLPGVAGRLGDYWMSEHDVLRSQHYYQIEIERHGGTFADFAGLADSQGLWNLRPLAEDREAAWPAPINGRDLSAQSRWYRQLGKYEEALECLNKALELEPVNYFRRVDRAYLTRQLGRIQQCLEDFRVAHQIQPQDARILVSLAEALRRLDRDEEGLDLLQAALITQPNDALILSHLAFCLTRIGDYEQAREVAERAYSITPNEPWTITAVAEVQAHFNSFEKARQVLLQGLRDHPDNSDILLSLSSTEGRARNWQEAESWARKAVDHSTVSNRIYCVEQLALSLQAQNELAAAESLFLELKNLDPQNPNWHWLLARTRYWQGETKSALRTLDHALALDPKFPEALILKGQLLTDTGDYETALLSLETAYGRANHTQQIWISYWIASLWFAQDNYPLTHHYLDRAIQKSEHHVQSTLLKAICMYREENYREALLWWERSQEIAFFPEVQADMAECYFKLGEEQTALREYARARLRMPTLVTTYSGEAEIRLDSPDDQRQDPLQAYRLMQIATRLNPQEESYWQMQARALWATIQADFCVIPLD